MSPLGDDHYRRIAELRTGLGYRYAQEIADMYGRPIGTVHRWVNEARRRGLLDPWENQTCRTCHRPTIPDDEIRAYLDRNPKVLREFLHREVRRDPAWFREYLRKETRIAGRFPFVRPEDV